MELGIPQDAFVVGHVGRFTYAKNQAFLLEIFAELLKQKSNARLLMVGEGELERELRQKVQSLKTENQVVFTGVRTDVDKLYSAMDVFCLPSFYEGLPVVLVEAQANGLPCVVSEQVTSELLLAGQCFCLPLDACGSWIPALLEKKRGQAVVQLEFEISYAAKMLGAFYQEKALGHSRC